MTLKKLFAPALCIILFFALTGCQNDESKPVDDGTYLSLNIGETTISVELAVSKEEQNRGLMYRREMPENNGMLFIFSSPTQMAFWMKNTYIPLDIAYIDSDGSILEIYAMYPQSTNSVMSRNRNILYALEMNQGWFAKNKITPGTKIDTEAVKKAVESRQKNRR